VRAEKVRRLNNEMPEEFGEERMAEQNKKKPNPIDAHVGGRIRMRRNMLGMSQEKLGESLGITFQQIQKYEKGTNRVGASRLQAIASIMEVPPAFFFENAPTDEHTPIGGLSEDSSMTSVMEFCSSSEGIQLNRAFVKIGDPKIRRRILELVKSLSDDDNDQ
jgi:transcriptional regulator with XRE-family HTH domain